MPGAPERISWAATTSSLPLPASSPTESRPTRGPFDPQHRLAEGGAEEGELDEVLGADLDVGADVEKEHRLARDRQLDGERRALNALQPAQAEGGGGHRRPGRAGAGHRAGAPLGDVAGGAHNRGLLLGANRGNRILRVGDPLGGGDHLNAIGAVKPQLVRRAEDTDADPVRSRHARALGKHVEPLLRPVPVKGNGHAAPLGHRYSESEGVAGVSATRCEITSRPA